MRSTGWGTGIRLVASGTVQTSVSDDVALVPLIAVRSG
jgi:hypothetical protein